MSAETERKQQHRLRWGVLGVGKISNDFSLGLINNGSCIAAVAGRDAGRAEEFRTKVGAMRAYSSYEELAQDAEVDIVYVGTIHTFHLPHTKLALEAGKHVVCEKPLGINEAQVQELVSLAREKKRFLMEAMWTRFFPATRRVRQALASQEVGLPKIVQCDFGFCAPLDPSSRLWDPEQAGGGMLDVGCYVVQAATMVFGPTVPDKVACTGELSDRGVDSDGCLSLTWTGKGSASLLFSLTTNTPEELLIMCTQGFIRVSGPAHCPTKIVLAKQEGRGNFAEEVLTFELPACPSHMQANFPNSEGFLYQVKAVEECIDAGHLECPEFTLDESLAVVKIMDAYRKQVGVMYSADA